MSTVGFVYCVDSVFGSSGRIVEDTKPFYGELIQSVLYIGNIIILISLNPTIMLKKKLTYILKYFHHKA